LVEIQITLLLVLTFRQMLYLYRLTVIYVMFFCWRCVSDIKYLTLVFTNRKHNWTE